MTELRNPDQPRQVRVVAHNPAWERDFEVESGHIARILGKIVLAVHHIGSTAIAGIAAKPIIDILLARLCTFR